MFIAAPGRKKSPITNSIIRPLKEIETDVTEKARAEAMEINNKKNELQAMIKETEKYISRALKEECEPEANEARKKLLELQIEDAQLMPLRPQLVANSLTMQKLGQICVENPGGILMNVDELGQLWDNMKKENSGLLRGFLLQGWGGLSSYRHQTVNSTEFNIQKLCISFMANVQPTLFNSMVDEQISKNSDDGFLQRSTICFDTERLHPFKDLSIDPKQKERAYNLYKCAYNVEPKLIKFEKKATSFIEEYQEKLDEMILKESLPMVGGFLSKFRGLLIKKAFMMDFMGSNLSRDHVTLKGVQMASEHLDLNYKNIKTALYAPAYEKARSFVGDLISCKIESGQNMSLIARQHKRYFENRFIENEMFALLIKNNYIKITQVGNAKKMLVNPIVYKKMPSQF